MSITLESEAMDEVPKTEDTPLSEKDFDHLIEKLKVTRSLLVKAQIAFSDIDLALDKLLRKDLRVLSVEQQRDLHANLNLLRSAREGLITGGTNDL